jgi:hypothetical protein
MTKHRDTSSPSTGSSNKAESESPYPENDHLDNEALERCVNAWRRNFELASISRAAADWIRRVRGHGGGRSAVNNSQGKTLWY